MTTASTASLPVLSPNPSGNAWVSAEDAPLRDDARRLRFKQSGGILVVDALYDRNCQWCSGRGKVIRNGTEKPCDCALARGQVFIRSLSVMGTPTTSELPKPLPEPRHNQRRAQIERLDAEIAALTARAGDARAKHDAAVAEKKAALDAAHLALGALQHEIDTHNAEGRSQRAQAAELRRQADELDRRAEKSFHAATSMASSMFVNARSGFICDGLPSLAAAAEAALGAVTRAEAERERVARHFEKQLRPLTNRRASISARLG